MHVRKRKTGPKPADPALAAGPVHLDPKGGGSPSPDYTAAQARTRTRQSGFKGGELSATADEAPQTEQKGAGSSSESVFISAGEMTHLACAREALSNPFAKKLPSLALSRVRAFLEPLMGPLAACRHGEHMKAKQAQWESLRGPANPPPHHPRPAQIRLYYPNIKHGFLLITVISIKALSLKGVINV